MAHDEVNIWQYRRIMNNIAVAIAALFREATMFIIYTHCKIYYTACHMGTLLFYGATNNWSSSQIGKVNLK